MKQRKKVTGRVLILFTLAAALTLVPNQARADGPIQCGGSYGWWSSEPYYIGDVWSITVTAVCEDGTVEQITGPADSSGTGLGDPTEVQQIGGGCFPSFDDSPEMDDE